MHSPILQHKQIHQFTLAVSCMLLMVQGYAFAPLQPTLSAEFHSGLVNHSVPLFILSFSLSAAGMLWKHEMLNLRICFFLSLLALGTGLLFISTAQSALSFLLIRILTGIGTGLMLPSALMLSGWHVRPRHAPFNFAIIMFSLATGMTFGPSLGGWLNDICGWRLFYRSMGITSTILAIVYYLNTGGLKGWHHLRSLSNRPSVLTVLSKNWNSYLFAFLTGIFHSSVFVWIIVYFTKSYQLTEYQVANELLLFGLPGLVVAFGLFRYKLDAKVLPILYTTLTLTIAGLLVLLSDLPLFVEEILLCVISLGFGCSQPLFIGLINIPLKIIPLSLGSSALFAGYGLGPIIMDILLEWNIESATIFAITIALSLIALSVFIWPGVLRQQTQSSAFKRAGIS